MFKRGKKDESKDSEEKSEVEGKSEANPKNKESENSKSHPVDDEKSESAEKPQDEEQAKTSDSAPSGKDKDKEDSDTESVNVEEISTEENVEEKGSDKEDVYYIDDVVNKGGYGKFQKVLTFFVGLSWFADGFEVIILSFITDFFACEWTIYRWQNALLTSLVFMGMTVGAPLFGMIADLKGRRTALGISMLLLFSFGYGSIFAKNFTTILVLRTFMGFALGGIAQGVTLCCEYYPAADRGIAGFYLSYYWAAGTILLILSTWVIMSNLDNWRYLLFAASSPACFCFLVIRWFPESARFYLVSQQPEKAVEQLERLARMNNIEMPKGKLKIPEGEEARGRILDLFKPEHRVTTLLLWYLWFAVAFTYYAFALIAPIIIKNGKLRVSKEKAMISFQVNETQNFLTAVIPCKKFTRRHYIDLLWTSAAEFPGLLAFTILVKYLNRKTLLSGSCLLIVLVAFLLLVDTQYRIVSNILLFLGRANAVAVLQLIFIMTTEAFPTTLRAIAMGSGSACARLGGSIVPFAAQLLVIAHPIATICIMGIIVFLASLAAAFLPRETKDCTLKELSDEYVKKDTAQGVDNKVV